MKQPLKAKGILLGILLLLLAIASTAVVFQLRANRAAPAGTSSPGPSEHP